MNKKIENNILFWKRGKWTKHTIELKNFLSIDIILPKKNQKNKNKLIKLPLFFFIKRSDVVSRSCDYVGDKVTDFVSSISYPPTILLKKNGAGLPEVRDEETTSPGLPTNQVSVTSSRTCPP